jgi:hypothetical protein
MGISFIAMHPPEWVVFCVYLEPAASFSCAQETVYTSTGYVHRRQAGISACIPVFFCFLVEISAQKKLLFSWPDNLFPRGYPLMKRMFEFTGVSLLRRFFSAPGSFLQP